MLLQNDWVKEEIKGEIKRYIETNEDDNTASWNFWDSAKAAIRGKFILLQAYLKKQKIFQVNNLTYFKELEKEEQKQHKVSRRKEIKLRAEFNEIENKKTILKLIQQKSGSLKRWMKLTHPWLDSLRKKRKKDSYRPSQKWERSSHRRRRNTKDHTTILWMSYATNSMTGKKWLSS